MAAPYLHGWWFFLSKIYRQATGKEHFIIQLSMRVHQASMASPTLIAAQTYVMLL